jgi:twinfilin
MLYSSGAPGVYQYAQSILESSTSVLTARKIETSDPKELDEVYLKDKLGLVNQESETGESFEAKKPFAKPRGPGRRR